MAQYEHLAIYKKAMDLTISPASRSVKPVHRMTGISGLMRHSCRDNLSPVMLGIVISVMTN